MPYFKKYKVVILAFDGALASAITGAMDIFSFVGISWQRFNNTPLEPRFEVSIASLHQQPVRCTNQLLLQPQQDIAQVNGIDILLIPTIGGDIDKVLENNRQLLPYIQKIANQGSDIASNCSGTFLLASAGLLDNRKATTHWGYADKFRAMFPQVNLKERDLITQSEQFFCAGGGVAFNDLCLLLIERYCGRDIANQMAKAHVINRQSGFQSTYANLHSFKQHKNDAVIKVQEFIEQHYQDKLNIRELAKMINVTERTLNRSFQKHVGMTPSRYIQSVRLENAKRLLEQGINNTRQLASLVGYEDPASFGRLFKQQSGFTPVEYRSTFQRNFIN
ncbi:GlxA family transcriptional regulator [Glaciecola sp. 1036]|uniref:GlxA family transcriptional regulator n=1 Tax=Alteromonadaceae TaxID=72275 RepID=UPI003D03D369